MAKIRVHELAKELNMESKEVLHRLQAAGVSVKGPMSAIESNQADFLRQEMGRATGADFVPKVTRIPKAVVEAAKAEEEMEAAAAQPAQEQQSTPAEPAAKAAPASADSKEQAAPAPTPAPAAAQKTEPVAQLSLIHI